MTLYSVAGWVEVGDTLGPGPPCPHTGWVFTRPIAGWAGSSQWVGTIMQSLARGWGLRTQFKTHPLVTMGSYPTYLTLAFLLTRLSCKSLKKTIFLHFIGNWLE